MRPREAIRHPFWQAVLLLVVAYVVFKFGVAYLPPLLGVRSAPVPRSVLVQYVLKSTGERRTETFQRSTV